MHRIFLRKIVCSLGKVVLLIATMSTLFIRIHHGPSEAFHTFAHRPQKLKGLRDALQRRGFRVELSPVEFKDLCLIELCGHEVFRCKMKSLMFNMPPHRDPVCQRAIVAVEEAFEKLSRAQYYVWLWAHIENEVFKRSDYAPQDYWDDVLELPPLAGFDCADCCHIILPRWQNRSNKRYLIRICTKGCCISPEVIAIPKKIPESILKKYYYLFFFLSKLLELVRNDNDLHVQTSGSRFKILDHSPI